MLRGAIAAAVTPLRDGGEALDEDAFAQYVDFLAASGLDGVLALGTTGEGFLLPVEQRMRAVSSGAGCSRTSVFAARVASGPEVSSSPIARSTAASRSSATSCTRPIRRAVAASNRSPVRKYRRACWPIRGSTNGEITAGMIPSLTSEKPKTASGAAIATSVQATKPEPPPRA